MIVFRIESGYPPGNPYRRYLVSVCYRWFEAATRGFKREAAIYQAAAEMLDTRARIWDLTEEISNRFAWEESR